VEVGRDNPLFLINIIGSDSAVLTTAGTAELFRDLYQQYLPRVYQYVNYRVGDRSEVEELTSKIFEKALSKFGSYDSRKASFSTWIFSIARNTVIDCYRERSRKNKLAQEIEKNPVTPSTSLEEAIDRLEEINKLRQCLLKLNQVEQELISLKYSGDMTNREIAKITGHSESNVGTILCRAIRKLREEFARW
jgi:RNA polymerase sigma-70 factor (ECF subfamily)